MSNYPDYTWEHDPMAPWNQPPDEWGGDEDDEEGTAMIDKETAGYIWHCMTNHGGYSEDRGEWCDALDIDPGDCDEFERFVAEKIEEL